MSVPDRAFEKKIKIVIIIIIRRRRRRRRRTNIHRCVTANPPKSFALLPSTF